MGMFHFVLFLFGCYESLMGLLIETFFCSFNDVRVSAKGHLLNRPVFQCLVCCNSICSN